MDKKKVYVETSVISNLTARPSHNLIDAARQAQTIAWWTDAPARFESDVMEELWRVKEELASQYASLREFFDALVARQNATHPEFATA